MFFIIFLSLFFYTTISFVHEDVGETRRLIRQGHLLGCESFYLFLVILLSFFRKNKLVSVHKNSYSFKVIDLLERLTPQN